jgi:hypothetical protein
MYTIKRGEASMERNATRKWNKLINTARRQRLQGPLLVSAKEGPHRAPSAYQVRVSYHLLETCIPREQRDSTCNLIDDAASGPTTAVRKSLKSTHTSDSSRLARALNTDLPARCVRFIRHRVEADRPCCGFALILLIFLADLYVPLMYVLTT